MLNPAFTVVAKDKKPKSQYMKKSGVIANKSEVADEFGATIQSIGFYDADKNLYACILLHHDARFFDFSKGDDVVVEGFAKPDSPLLTSCRISVWTSRRGQR
jgi:hypothetical protein